MPKHRIVPVLWGLKHRELAYTSENFKDPDQQSKWIHAGHQPPAITTQLHVVKSPYDWMAYVGSYFPDLDNISYCFSRFIPGTYFPMHTDRYALYKKMYNIDDINSIMRYVVFLEDAQPGHILQVDGRMYDDWPRGFSVGWQSHTAHLSANLGLQDRYTLQITGVIKLHQ